MIIVKGVETIAGQIGWGTLIVVRRIVVGVVPVCSKGTTSTFLLNVRKFKLE